MILPLFLTFISIFCHRVFRFKCNRVSSSSAGASLWSISNNFFPSSLLKEFCLGTHVLFTLPMHLCEFTYIWWWEWKKKCSNNLEALPSIQPHSQSPHFHFNLLFIKIDFASKHEREKKLACMWKSGWVLHSWKVNSASSRNKKKFRNQELIFALLRVQFFLLFLWCVVVTCKYYIVTATRTKMSEVISSFLSLSFRMGKLGKHALFDDVDGDGAMVVVMPSLPIFIYPIWPSSWNE